MATRQNGSSRRAVFAGAAGLAAAAGAAAARDLRTPVEPAAGPARPGRFAGKVVLITGATSGIGAATARAFALEGARVMFCGRREALGEEVAGAIRKAGGEARFHRADVRVEAEVAGLVKACVAAYGGLDIAFNNAGIGRSSGQLGDLDWTAHDDLMATNLTGVLRCIDHEVPALKARGGGVIVNTASVLGHRGSTGTLSYGLSKAGVLHLTRSAALQLAPHNIRVVSVSPGPINTPMMAGGAAEASGRNTPSGRGGQPEEVARAVMFLASDEASYTTGDDLRVDGGLLAR